MAAPLQRFQGDLPFAFCRIHFGGELTFVPGGHDQQSEEQAGIQRFNFETAGGIGRHLFLAIGIARWAKHGGSLFRPGGVDENGCPGDGSAIGFDNLAGQIRSRAGRGRQRSACTTIQVRIIVAAFFIGFPRSFGF